MKFIACCDRLKHIPLSLNGISLRLYNFGMMLHCCSNFYASLWICHWDLNEKQMLHYFNIPYKKDVKFTTTWKFIRWDMFYFFKYMFWIFHFVFHMFCFEFLDLDFVFCMFCFAFLIYIFCFAFHLKIQFCSHPWLGKW